MHSAPQCLNTDTVPYFLHKRATTTPTRIAYSFPELGQNCSWSELWNEVQATAKGLLRVGIEPGDRIALLLPDRIETIVSIYSAGCVGAVTVPLNTYSKKAELVGYLRDARAKAIVLGSGCHGLDFPSLMREILSDHALDPSSRDWIPSRIFAVGCTTETNEGFEDFSILSALGRDADECILWSACRELKHTDHMVILYTSGTTGHPKRVVRNVASFLNSVSKAEDHRHAFSVTTSISDMMAGRLSLMNLLPLYHLGGIAALFTNLVDVNLRTVMLQYYHPVRALEILDSEGCQLLHCTPYMLSRMLSVPERQRFELSALIGVYFSGAAASAALLREIDEHLDVCFFGVSYGSTEAGAVANGIVVRDRKKPVLARFLKLLLRTGVVGGEIPYASIRSSCYGVGGKVSRSAEVRVLDITTGQPLPAGIPGEIVVRGHRVMDRDPRDAADTPFTGDGWLRTGDIGYLDEDRCLFVVERLKRVISRGGEKISALEVEDCLCEHESVAEAFAYGVPDPTYGEEICACVKPREEAEVTPDDLRRFLSSRLSAFKVPRDIVLVDSFPLSSTGKVSVADLRLLASSRTDEPPDDNS